MNSAAEKTGLNPDSVFTVDFHTHVFPDNLAGRAVSILSEKLSALYTPVSDGTIRGLLENMRRWGINRSVALPVITNPEHFKTVNEFAAARNNIIPEIEFFGGLHPADSKWKENIDFIVSLGLKGIKLHPEYQDFRPADKSLFPMYEYALSKGLILVFHAGVDPGKNQPCKSSPEQFAEIASAMKGGVIVAAHLGGNMQWDEVEEHLAGKDIYMDTSTGFKFYGKEKFLRIAKKHGAEKLLFASDSPWDNAGTEKQTLISLADTNGKTEYSLSENEVRLIAGMNAARILNIKI